MSYLDATADLLEVARSHLREAVMPRLDAETRYEAALVANAMAIANRELELGARTRAEERALLADFLGAPDDALPELRARFCHAMRCGALTHEEEVRQLLRDLVHARLAISNPGYIPTTQP